MTQIVLTPELTYASGALIEQQGFFRNPDGHSVRTTTLMRIGQAEYDECQFDRRRWRQVFAVQYQGYPAGFAREVHGTDLGKHLARTLLEPADEPGWRALLIPATWSQDTDLRSGEADYAVINGEGHACFALESRSFLLLNGTVSFLAEPPMGRIED